ncbi:unnamed protein product [Pleuronectes platessa]|uniref:Uncharacterized protein n=1 Tax=Pleuronectes platessa TaxID=8262 RepID=A0A9N7VSW0_PLEPL|nr:unnamed protein product [Pleuronectes platessa]
MWPYGWPLTACPCIVAWSPSTSLDGQRGECRNECEDPDAGDCALGVSAVFCYCWSHGLHGAWQRAGRGLSSEKNGPAEPCKRWSDPQTSRLEEETPTAPSFPQGAYAILEQGTALSALPQIIAHNPPLHIRLMGLVVWKDKHVQFLFSVTISRPE